VGHGLVAVTVGGARFDRRGAEFRHLLDRTREIVVIAAVIGGLTGLAVAAFESVTSDAILARVTTAPVWLEVVAPLAGLLVAAAALRWLADGATPSTADEYIKAVPDPEARFALRPVAGRVVACVATLGGGGAMGFEGPSIYIGAALGVLVHGRLKRVLWGVDRHAALVAGAAAGVAAIFKAPATGAVFALEVPYQDDLASHALLPALVGGATGYAVFAAIHGTDPLIPVSGRPPVDLTDLVGAVVVGLTCGVGARLFAWLIAQAKHRAARGPAWGRALAAGVVLGALVVVSRSAFDGRAFTLGPGYRAVEWALDPHRSLAAVALLATLRVVATTASVGGGGAGGLFVPLVVQGALTGRLIGGVVGGPNESLFVVLGIAGFLGAGYRVPLAAVMFVAEATGRPGFVVPGLLTAVVAQLVMGTASVSAYQRRRRTGHVEERSGLPIRSVLVPDGATAGADDTIARFFATHVATARRRAVAVVDEDGRYAGMLFLTDVLTVDPAAWGTTSLAEVMRADAPVGRADWTIGQALAAMLAADVDHLPVVDDAGSLLGVCTTVDILDLDELLDRLDSDGGSGDPGH
jgi:CIC family chloride channel protein